MLGIKLTFDKRYITLAPVSTLIGLAFRMYDPDALLGDTRDIGITLALLPRETPGVEVGRRHFPLNSPFQNGPIHGREGVHSPLSQSDWWRGHGRQRLEHAQRMSGGGGRSITPSSPPPAAVPKLAQW